ncbi:MAG TPA: SMP-30/gluconolactonase/LRE family protein [Gemmataceae bacterium]|nr:SMP-30/gluconolactonase/LRE family protein [Gemmataceae bacterium]
MFVRNFLLLCLCTLALSLIHAPGLPAADEAAKPIAGIGPTGEIVKLHTGFKFTEGPAADRAGNVYFSDIPNQRIHKVDAKGKLSVVSEKSNHANGLMLNAKGEIVACEMDGRIAAYSADGKSRRVLADKYEGKRFNAPNDLVIDKQGGIYFTDPAFSAPMPLPQGKTCVYHIAPKGKVTRLIDDLPNPNGVILSPDEKTLYVIPSGQAEMMAYAVESSGKIGKGRVFCTLKQKREGGKSGGDGLTVDTKGNLYITSALGLQVFDPSGKLLGIIALPEQPANVTFGGADFKTLYVTARTSLYTVPMEATGHRFARAMANPQPFLRTRDVIYGHKSGIALTMDVFTPKKGGNGAAIVLIVSGGWVSNPSSIDASWFTSGIEESVKRGYTVFAVCHGSQPRFTIPDAIADINRAIRYIRHYSSDYQIDPQRIGVTGGSAGGHLSLMQGTAGNGGNPRAKDAVERTSSRVQAVACFFPPTDFLNYGKTGQHAFAENGVLANFRTAIDVRELDKKTHRLEHITDKDKVESLCRRVSPISHVSIDDPPTLIIHGDADKLVPIQQAELMVAKLKQAGVPAELIVKKGAGHGWGGIGKDMITIVDWFDKYLQTR